MPTNAELAAMIDTGIKVATAALQKVVTAAAELQIAPTPTPIPPTLAALERAAIAHVRALDGQSPPPPPPPSRPPSAFRWLDATNFARKPGEIIQQPDTWATGTLPNTTKVAYFYGHQVYGPGVPFSLGLEPNESAVRAAFANLKKTPPCEFLVVDIESFPWGLQFTDEVYEASIGLMVKALTMVKRVRDEMGYKSKMGLYGYIPLNLWNQCVEPEVNPVLTAHRARMPALNDLLKPIVDIVDFVSPSCYLPEPNAAKYDKYIRFVASEARRISQGKPVYMHTWDRYLAGSDPYPGITECMPIPDDIWRAMLRSLHTCPDIDGVVMWGGSNTASAEGEQFVYSADDPWYVSLQAEIAR